MKAAIIDGRAIAAKIVASSREKLARLRARPVLVSITVGDNPSVASYVKNQQRVTASAGIGHETLTFDATVAKRELLDEIERLNREPGVTGIIVNLPLPERMNTLEIQSAVEPRKDAEGLHPVNLGALLCGGFPRGIWPCAAAAVLECIRASGSSLKGREIVIVGHGDAVGKPLAALLLAGRAAAPTVTVCHAATKNLAAHTRQADILVAAAGRAGLITKDMVKENAVVIDVGINSVQIVDDRGQTIMDAATGRPAVRIVGDVLAEEVGEIASAVTPVPGGVGPVTSAMLVRNIVYLASRQRRDKTDRQYEDNNQNI